MISNCGHDENNRYSGGKAGDQTGTEWRVINWYNRPWKCVLRHPDAKVRKMIASMAKAAAVNNKIGYDQSERYTFWEHLKASNYDPAQITIACEADCSSGVAAIVKGAGYRLGNEKMKNVSIYLYTGNMRADGNKTGTVDAETFKEMTTVNDDVSELATGDNEQETQQENAEDDENASNEDKATNPPTEQENGENGANTEADEATEDEQEDKVIIPQGKMRVTVVCDGSLNIRRSAAWGNDNICGRAIRGQSYYVKEIHVVNGKKMVRTIGDLYLSGESEHVQFEQL